MNHLVCLIACAAAPAALAQPGELPRAERIAPRAVDTLAPVGDYGLRALLRAGYDIIHIDAPVGQTAARFILRKGDKIYSCAPTLYREGGDSGAVRVIETPCIDLTP